MAVVIVDPELPESVRRKLEWAPLSALLGFNDPPPKPSRGLMPWKRRHVTGTYHRRYVVPELDLHGDAAAMWDRTNRAAKQIKRSEAIRLELIDSVEVNAVLPCHLWEVAERLALLSAPELPQQRVLQNLDPGDPEVRAVLDTQRRARELTIADIEPRVRHLEAFAGLAESADAALKRQRALQELADLNPDYEELLARLGGSDNVLTATGHLADELRAVAHEADEAVRRANEAGRTLVLPDRIPR